MNYSTQGWGEYANCLVTDQDDTSFITKPDEFSEKRWAGICAKCPVFDECLSWSNRLDVHGVFVAGEWRD